MVLFAIWEGGIKIFPYHRPVAEGLITCESTITEISSLFKEGKYL